MILARTLLFGFPLLVAALSWWAVQEARKSHEHGKDGIVVMLAQNPPGLNPFAPATEAERQIFDLLHAPLLRIDDQGELQPVLADLWRWSEDVTCWFADEAAAKKALELLQAQIGETNRWADWRLQSAQVLHNTLLMSFGETATTGAQQAFEVIAPQQPQPVAFWRVESGTALRAEWGRLLATMPEAGQIHRVWFDGANACEFVVTGPSQRVLDALRAGLSQSGGRPVQLTLLGEAGALVEPVLDLDMRPGRTWDDGTPVTAEDARATLEFLRGREWPLPVHEVLRQMQSLQTHNEGARLHVTFRKRYGPALAALADLPILPAAWLRAHPQAEEQDFSEAPPPGAGTHRITAREARSLILEPVEEGREAARFVFNFSATPLMTQIGMSTRMVDLVWPAASAGERVPAEQLRETPARQRLVVLFNTRHALLRNVRFREALSLAADISALLHAPERTGRADASVFAPGLWYSTGAVKITSLERAREIMEEEGWPRDVRGVARRGDAAFEFTLLAPESDALHERVAADLVTQWRALGARVRVEFAPDAQALARRLREHQFDAVLLDQRFEVSWDQLPWWHSSQAKAGGTNFCGIADPQIDLRLEALAAEADPAAVPQRVRDLEQRLLPLHAMLPLVTTHETAAMVSQPPDSKGQALYSWTLRALALPARRAPSAPVIDLRLRSPDQ